METKLQDNPMELEHVIGFSGRHAQTVCAHPQNPDLVLLGMGCNIVIQNTKDDHSQNFLQGHDENISTVVVSKKGTFAASGQEGSRRHSLPHSPVIVWDLNHKIDVYTLRGIKGGVRSLAFSPDEMFLAGSGADGALFIWDMQTGEIVANLGSNQVSTTLIWGPLKPGANKFRPEYTLIATGHKVIAYNLVYSVGSMMYQVEKTDFKMAAGMSRDYLASCVSPCGTSLILCTSVSDVNVYNLQNLVYSASFPICSGGARSVCASNSHLFVGGGDGTLKRLIGSGASWRLDSDIMLKGAVNSLSVLMDDRQTIVYAGTTSGILYEIDGDHMRIIRETHSETASVSMISFKKSCSIRFATVNDIGQVRVWDLSDYSVIADTKDSIKGDSGTCVVFDDNNGIDEAVAGYSSGYVRSFDASPGPSAGRKLWEIAPAHAHGVSSICATRLYYATGGTRGGVRLWSRSSKAQLFEFSDHISKPVMSLVADCSQVHLLHSCGLDRSIFTYDLKKEKRLVQHSQSHGGGFVSMTQHLHEDYELVTAGTDGRLLTWDFDIADPVSEVSLQDFGAAQSGGKAVGFTFTQISPSSGTYIAASSSDSYIRVWDTKSGQLVAISQGSAFADIVGLAWSPDEKQIVAIGQDMCIYVWNFYADLINGSEEKW